jgi:hypothetical protein
MRSGIISEWPHFEQGVNSSGASVPGMNARAPHPPQVTSLSGFRSESVGASEVTA